MKLKWRNRIYIVLKVILGSGCTDSDASRLGISVLSCKPNIRKCYTLFLIDWWANWSLLHWALLLWFLIWWVRPEDVLCLNIIINEDLLKQIGVKFLSYIRHLLLFLGRSLIRLSKWIKLTNQYWPVRYLPREDVASTSDAFGLVWCALSLRVWCHNLSVLALRIVSVCHQWWIKLLFWIVFFLLLSGILVTLQRFLCANLPQHIFHWCSLHVLQHSLLTKTSATHWGWADSSHRWTCWKSVLLCESSSWWTHECWYWNLFRDWNKCKEIMLQHFRQIHTFKWIYDQALFDEVFRICASLDVIRELECTSFDLFVGLFDLLRLERRATVQHCV